MLRMTIIQKGELMSDLISRQAAIDIVEFECGEWSGLAKTIAEEIKQLSSTQPEPCEDAVSREKVKELAYSQIRSKYSGIALKEQREAMLRIADNVIGLLPSVTPKQRTGKWIFTKDYYWICSECGKNPTRGVGYVQGSSELFPHCPYCGSRNEVTT
jgi:rubrerythrin